MRLTVSPGLIVHPKIGIFFRLNFWSYVQLKFENFFKTLLFEFLSFSNTLLFCSFIILKRAHEANIPSSYIYCMKTTNEQIVGDII